MSEWLVHVDNNNMDFFVRNMLSITVIHRFPDGSAEYNVDWGSMNEEGGSQVPTRYRAVGNQNNFGVPADQEVRKPMPILIDIEAAREMMDALGKHFGIYAGADYARLKEDYDFQREQLIASRNELAEANEFIRETLDTTLDAAITHTGRVPPTPGAGGRNKPRQKRSGDAESD